MFVAKADSSPSMDSPSRDLEQPCPPHPRGEGELQRRPGEGQGASNRNIAPFLYPIQHCTAAICIDSVYMCCFILSIHVLKAEAHHSHI
jgi:hypothetical protein